MTLAAGSVYIHVHGSADHDTVDGTREAIAGMAQFFATRGVTSFCPTSMTMGGAEIMQAVRAVKDCMDQPVKGAQPLGVHLEGPYIDTKMKGAQPEQLVRPASASDYQEFFFLGNIRMISVAPETWSGVSSAIRMPMASPRDRGT